MSSISFNLHAVISASTCCFFSAILLSSAAWRERRWLISSRARDEYEATALRKRRELCSKSLIPRSIIGFCDSSIALRSIGRGFATETDIFDLKFNAEQNLFGLEGKLRMFVTQTRLSQTRLADKVTCMTRLHPHQDDDLPFEFDEQVLVRINLH